MLRRATYIDAVLSQLKLKPNDKLQILPTDLRSNIRLCRQCQHIHNAVSTSVIFLGCTQDHRLQISVLVTTLYTPQLFTVKKVKSQLFTVKASCAIDIRQI